MKYLMNFSRGWLHEKGHQTGHFVFIRFFCLRLSLFFTIMLRVTAVQTNKLFSPLPREIYRAEVVKKEEAA
jgi:hypothetical protein